MSEKLGFLTSFLKMYLYSVIQKFAMHNLSSQRERIKRAIIYWQTVGMCHGDEERAGN